METEQRIAIANRIVNEIYFNDSVCMFDLLSTTELREVMPEDATLEDAFYVYMHCMHIVEGDAFIQVRNDNDYEKLV